jgi:SnoaL-like domain
MENHPVAAAVATTVAERSWQRFAAAVTEDVRLRALLPGGPIQAHGRDDVVACFHGFFAAFDAVRLVASAGEAVGDRLLIHYRLHVTRGTDRRVCTQTAVCTLVDERLAVIDLLCSGLQEVFDEDVAHVTASVTAASGARRVG